MIKQIVSALKANQMVSGWLVSETATVSSQVFYVMQKKETTRRVETREYQVTVYHRHGEQHEYLGSSAFAVSRKSTKSELAKKVEAAVFAASFVKNKTFDLVKGERKRSWKDPADLSDPYVLLDEIANVFFAAATPVSRFNALEAFHSRQTIRILNSEGVDLTKTLAKINIEAIPSHDGPERKVELIRMYAYRAVNLEQVKKDAAAAIADVAMRYAAVKIENVATADVILQGDDVEEFLRALIDDYSYDSIYQQNTDKRIGDMIQKDIRGDALSIGWTTFSKADAFDRDGVLLSPVRVVEQGKLMDYYGANQYAQYLGMKPNGVFSTIEAACGKTTIARMKVKPHLEILALSGIQIDTYSGYIGGEVRLAVWFDGKNLIPVSGFSFSGNIDKALSDLVLSKEAFTSISYRGPKCLLLKAMDVL